LLALNGRFPVLEFQSRNFRLSLANIFDQEIEEEREQLNKNVTKP